MRIKMYEVVIMLGICVEILIGRACKNLLLTIFFVASLLRNFMRVHIKIFIEMTVIMSVMREVNNIAAGAVRLKAFIWLVADIVIMTEPMLVISEEINAVKIILFIEISIVINSCIQLNNFEVTYKVKDVISVIFNVDSKTAV